MKFKKIISLSPRILSTYRQLTGDEATAWLTKQGYTFIRIGKDDTIEARTKDDKFLTGYRIYEREVPVVDD